VRKFVLLGAHRSDERGAADDENASLRFSLGNVPTAADYVADVSGAQACETAGLVP